MTPRVLVGQFMFEANTFSAGCTTADDFRELAFGDDARRLASADRPDELGGALRRLERAGIETVPAVVAVCGPGPTLAAGLVEEIVERTAAAAGEVDGCYLALHGAAVSETDDDPEGTLLAAVRERLGHRPLVASLDLHAQLTQAMTDAADAFATYHTSPHTDIESTGERAAALLVDALAGKTAPVTAAAGRPMLTPADTHDSTGGAYGGLMALCREVERRDGVLAAGLCTTQPWIDIPELGWRAVVTADGDETLARTVAEEIAEAAWAARHALSEVSRPSLEEALADALGGPGPCVVSEASDSTNAGALGDSTEMLRAALPYAHRRIYLSTRDPEAAAVAFAAGEGATVTLTIGRGREGAYNGPVEVVARVERLFDGSYAHTTAVCPGLIEHPGPTALLRVDGLCVVVHSRRTLLTDPVLYEALGLDPAEADVVQAKSPVSFRAGFARVTDRMIVAEGTGPSCGRLQTLEFTRRPRPLHPFEEDPAWATGARA